LKRFAAPLWVFIFGIVFLLSILFAAGGDHHGDMITLQPGLLFNIKFTGKQLSNSIKYFHPHLRSDDFTSPEKHGNLRLVSFFKEPIDIFDLELEIVVSYLRPDLHFFKVSGLSRSVLFAHLILIFAEVHHPADRRADIWGNLNQIVTAFP